jgi:hypothetical protein
LLLVGGGVGLRFIFMGFSFRLKATCSNMCTSLLLKCSPHLPCAPLLAAKKYSQWDAGLRNVFGREA